MSNEEKIIVGLSTALTMTAVVIIRQRELLKEAKTNTKIKEGVGDMYKRAFERACGIMTPRQLLSTFHSLNEESRFENIIKDF